MLEDLIHRVIDLDKKLTTECPKYEKDCHTCPYEKECDEYVEKSVYLAKNWRK